MKLHVIDGDGGAAVIHDDLEIEPSDSISAELRQFIDRARGDEEPASLDSLEPEFLVDLYVETSVRRVEPASLKRSPGLPWERRRPRYRPPTSDAGARTNAGSVDRGDDFGPDSATRSPDVERDG